MAQKRILIVDDEKLVRWALTQKCAEFGFQTLEAENGEEAIRALQNDTVDAVLLDVHVKRVRRYRRPQLRWRERCANPEA